MEIKEYQILYMADGRLLDNGVHINTIEQIESTFPIEKGYLVVDSASLPADFSVDTYTIVGGKLVQASAKVIAERNAARQAVADAAQIAELKAYLSSTDWAVVKCAELAVPLAELYPQVAAKRTAARARINEIEFIN